MNFTKYKFNILLISILISVNSNIVAQQWVNEMQDTSLSLSQKSQTFETYWADRAMEKGKGFKT